MSTLSPKKIEGTPEEMRAVLKADIKKMMTPFFITYTIFYYLYIVALCFGYAHYAGQNLAMFFPFVFYTVFSVVVFQQIHLLASEGVENGEQTILGVLSYVWRRKFEVKKSFQYSSRNFDFYWGGIILTFLATIHMTTNLPVDTRDYIGFYGTGILFINGFMLLPFTGFRILIFTKIAQNNEVAKKLEREAINLNMSILKNILVSYLYVALICIFIPIIAVIVEPICCLVGYIFYKHVFEDGMKMTSKIKSKIVITIPKSNLAHNLG